MHLASWGQNCTTEETNEFALTVGLRLTEQIENEELRQCISRFLTSRAYSAICDYSVDYTRTTCSDASVVRQVCALFSKRADLDIGIDKEQAARATFNAAESLCLETNHILKLWTRGRFMFDRDVESVLYCAQRKISNLLGEVPDLASLRFRFGPGATTQIKRGKANAKRKLAEPFCCSEDLAPYVSDVLDQIPAWVFREEDPESVVSNVVIHDGRLAFVPKNAKTFRSVAVEPMLNTFVQLGIGEYMADRLRRVGINIADQTRNQDLARIGSITGALATLDLSSASDTIAYELIAHLLPIDWFLFLSKYRTGTIEIEGVPVKLQKFSSMGNGFTFPLETLIFWALTSACTNKNDQEWVSVYGDDIILPSANAPLLVRVLNACGFVVNTKKSFVTGPFRESCGKDYYSGILIRPFYLKDRLSGESLFTMHNFFVRKGDTEIAAMIPPLFDKAVLLYGPDKYGDGHLIGPWRACPHRRQVPSDPRKSGGWGGYTFETYTWQPKKDLKPSAGDWVFPFYSCYVLEKKKTLSEATCLADFLNLEDRPTQIARNGTPVLDYPGKQKYRRIKIYTFDPAGAVTDS
jgi:hypothetical protein